ncbi:DUF4142 domain-containing protein [Mesorhizobium sp.]|uniref:DUF4142 domain-containing protein n=1 Tax=Mesorhizobium sp. TaxID=1871066 RepID=UPI003BA91ED1
MIKPGLIAAVAAIAILPSLALAQSDAGKSVPTIPATQIEPRKVATPLEFVSTASSGNSFEIDSGNLALKKAQSAEVKAFAKTMVDDHSQAQQELVGLATNETVEFGKPAPDGEQQGMLGKLDTVKGSDFDVMYVETQIYAHQRAISLYKGYAQGTSPLNQFAAKTLPTIVMHYQIVLDLGQKLKVKPVAQ